MYEPEAVIAVCSTIQRDWGYTGYKIECLAPGPTWGSVIASVTYPGDGSYFAVGADRHGNTQHADTVEGVHMLLAAAAPTTVRH